MPPSAGVSQLIRVFDGHDERMSERDELRQHREELRRRYGAAYNRLSSLLFEEDPVGINFEHNADEYEPEAGTILPRLRSCGSVADVREVPKRLAQWTGISPSPSASGSKSFRLSRPALESVPSNKRMKLTKRECLVGGPALARRRRAAVIESRFAAYARCSTDALGRGE